ncbi:MAG: PadR family transcriptional regulator [Thermoplasmata archaeon]
MGVPARPVEGFRRRAIGMYALTLMDRDGPLHGYGLSERIGERTEGAWRPGPGAIYPSLRKLVTLGLARSRLRGRRREYEITPRGRALIVSLRAPHGPIGPAHPDLSGLWAEIMGSPGAEDFLLDRLRRAAAAIEAHAREADPGFSGRAASELDRAAGRLRRRARRPRSREER